MTIIQRRIKTVLDLKRAVKNHPMCLQFIENHNDFTVYYPEGYFPNGVLCRFNPSKSSALTKILKQMEKHWSENYPFSKG